MQINFSDYKFVIVVVDSELSTYRGILRICPFPNTETHYFESRDSLFAWLRCHYAQLSQGTWTSCLVVDACFADIFDESAFDVIWLNCSKIYLSRQFKDLQLLRNLYIGSSEFIHKPFKLEEMKLVLEQVFSWHIHRLEISRKFNQLTRRELETCELVVKGFSSSQISAVMGISIKTVKVHRANLMGKIKAKSVADLIRDYHTFTAPSNLTDLAFNVSLGV
ncbi:response regulator transcription factor [Methylomonas rapida]|uniref:LuxR C-terminal-related transcriptional regulator n=1 Tax=Methylomonas rapida TaxID=2963939 RepID=A0ABY7GFI2_9GAMM|nr:LuxR C-terminal-related transcriptional regulator [Methylomonas rapida]WAR43216.1 LuxR C-terminal-related transcriptional regulator [Methylomonas rapida]